jgi:hypothetical protein
MLNIYIPATKVSGDGSSIWMDSSVVKATMTSFKVWFMENDTIWDKSEIGNGYSLTVEGADMPWQAYTDKSIEKQILKIVTPYLKKQGYKIEWLKWSEQGMQDTDAWNFDVKIIPEKKKRFSNEELKILNKVPQNKK